MRPSAAVILVLRVESGWYGRRRTSPCLWSCSGSGSGGGFHGTTVLVVGGGGARSVEVGSVCMGEGGARGQSELTAARRAGVRGSGRAVSPWSSQGRAKSEKTGAMSGTRRQRGRAQRRGTAVPRHGLTLEPFEGEAVGACMDMNVIDDGGCWSWRQGCLFRLVKYVEVLKKDHSKEYD